MYLENLNIRVKKYPKGYAVEVEKEKKSFFRTKKYWVHIISVSGMSDVPWYYKTKEIAIEETLKYVKWTLLDS